MANSTSQAVGEQAVAILTELGLAVGTPPVPLPIIRRKTPGVPEGASAGLPQLVVSVGEEGKTEYLTATQKLKTYPVAVTVVTNTGRQLADDDTVRQWRQQIELAVENFGNWAALTPGLSGFNEVNLTNKAPFDTAALSKDYNYATVVADVQVIEPRG